MSVGALVSIVNTSPALLALSFPAASVAVATRLWVPSVSVAVSMLQAPVLGSATAVPSTVLPSYSVTMLPTSAVPVTVGVLSLVSPPALVIVITGAVLSTVYKGPTNVGALFNNTDSVSGPTLAVTRSGLPSPFRSPIATAIGAFPVR